MHPVSSESDASQTSALSAMKTADTMGVGQDLLTVKETSEYLRIPLPTVYYLVQRGQLPAAQIGGRWRTKKKLAGPRYSSQGIRRGTGHPRAG